MKNGKIRKTRRFIAFVLALIMLLGFAPNLDLKASAAAPTSYTDIAPGGSAAVSITTAGGAKYFRFVPTVTDDYTFYSDNNSGDTYVELLNSSGTQIAYNDDGAGNNLNFSLTYTCEANTTYYIKARMFSSSATGSYTLHVTGWAPASCSDILAGGSASVNITSSNGVKYFRFVPTVTAEYTFYSDNNGGNSADTYVRLLDATGTQLAYNDDAGNGNNFSLAYNCVAGTTYFIEARMYSTNTGSYTLYVSSAPTSTPEPTPDPVVPDGDYVEINVAGGTNYSLFNSGATGEGCKYSSTANYDEASYDNNGYDLYAEDGTSVDTIRLGLSFVITTENIDNINIAIHSYDVDENGSSSCNERDYIYLVDETAGGSTTKLEGYLSGQDDTWNTTRFVVDGDYFEYGHSYYLMLEVTCTSGCTHFWVYTRTVDLIVNGASEPLPEPVTGIENADVTASISSSGLVSASLTANAYTAETYTLEYKAVYSSASAQYGGKEYSVNIQTTTSEFNTTFQLESGAPRGTYEITVFIKDSNGVVKATRTVVVSYGYSAVSYNSNGGSQNVPTDGTTYTSGNTVSVRFDYVPSRYGYVFLGWSTDSNATEPMYTENGTNTFTIGSTDVTLYAVWQVEGPSGSAPDPTPDYDVWDGSIANGFGGGTGTQADPYLIYTAAQLAYLASSTNAGNSYSGKHFKLMNNLDLNNVEWTPIGIGSTTNGNNYDTLAFSGTFNGNGYYISKLSINNTSLKRAGLFGSLNNATVTMLGITEANVAITQRHIISGGVIAGTAYMSTITKCEVSGEVSVTDTAVGDSRWAAAGMILGHAGGGVLIDSCFANGNVSGYMPNDWNAYVGGIIGETDYYNGNNAVSNTYFCGDVFAHGYLEGYAGGIIGANFSTASIRNCFAVANISSSDYADAISPAVNGNNRPVTTNSYYSSATSSVIATSTSLTNLQSQYWIESTLGWDFDTVWEFNSLSEYPVLQGFNQAGNNPSHVHSFEEVSRTEPTCTTDGLIEYECVCGEISRVQVIPAHGHNYEENSVVEATCLEDGYVSYVCTYCQDEKVQVIYATGHVYGNDNICDNCGYEKVVHNHDYDAYVVNPTCTTMGYTVYSCACGDSYRADFIDQTGHRWNDGVVTIEKTCTTDGLITYYCTECNETRTSRIPAGHNWDESIVYEATCYEDGLKSCTCLDCGETTTEIIPAGHNWNEGFVVVEATCTTEGLKSCTCLDCGTSEDIVIDVLGHEFRNGVCIRCGATIPEVVVPNDEHLEYGMYFNIDDIISNYGPDYINEYGVLLDYNEDAIIKKVAVYLTQEGTMWRRCIAVVGDNITYATYVPYLSYDEDIKYTGLNSSWINTFRLQPNADGIWCYSNYATIGVNLEDAQGNLLLSLYDIGQAGAKTRIFDDLDEMIEWLKNEDGCIYHEESDWIIDYDATCLEDGQKHKYCLLCGQTLIIEPIPARGYHVEGEWIVDCEETCLEDGQKHKECLDCGEVLVVEPIPARGYHVESEWITDYDATCLEDGQKHKECLDCGEITAVERISAFGHVPSDWIVDEEPTATTPGSRHKECLTCGDIIETGTISVLGKITVSNATASVGSVVEIAISVENNPGVLGAVLTIDFGDGLELMSARAGNAWTMLNLTTPAYYTSPCNFVWDGINGADSSNGNIIILTFRVSDSAEVGAVYDITASYTQGNLVNGNLESVDMQIENGYIEIDVIKGDVNHDGVVDVADVVALRRYLAGGYNVDIEWLQSDIDEDGMITVADVVLLRRYIVNGHF